MIRLFQFMLLLLFMFFSNTENISANNKVEKSIYVINIKQNINNTSRIILQKGLNEAQQKQSDVIILHMNTYGGLVEAADSMRSAILYNKIPVYTFIDNNAASAGALISIASQKIYMRKGANIGAASVVNESGEVMPDKYQSYMRSIMRSTAEAHGKDTLIQNNDTIYKWKRDPLIAEAMVDERTIVPNLCDSGKVLTLTAEEALKWGYCDGIAESLDEIITQELGYKQYTINEYQPSFMDLLKGFLTNPVLQSFLIMFIIGGIYFEMQAPGLGLPSLVAIVSAVLYFAPLYIDGLALYWEILLFIIGILLILIEIFVLPGFGVAGISGIVLTISGLLLALLNNINFEFESVDTSIVQRATYTVICGLIVGLGLTIWISHKIGQKGILKNMALEESLDEKPDYTLPKELIGQTGIASSDLRPSGKVLIGNQIYDAISNIGYIEQGSKVVVTKTETAQIYVDSEESKETSSPLA